jgi:tocopherol cyclase
VELVGTTDRPGTMVQTPGNNGLRLDCRDTLQGRLGLTLRTRDGELIVAARSNLAGLEVGGGPWSVDWISRM